MFFQKTFVFFLLLMVVQVPAADITLTETRQAELGDSVTLDFTQNISATVVRPSGDAENFKNRRNITIIFDSPGIWTVKKGISEIVFEVTTVENTDSSAKLWVPEYLRVPVTTLLPILAAVLFSTTVLYARKKKRYVVPSALMNELLLWQNVKQLKEMRVERFAEIFSTEEYGQSFLNYRDEGLTDKEIRSAKDEYEISYDNAKALLTAKNLKAMLITKRKDMLPVCRRAGIRCVLIRNALSTIEFIQEDKNLARKFYEMLRIKL